MLITLTKKLLYLSLMLLIISLVSFLMIHLAPGSFFASGALNPNITPESLEHLKAVYGLDEPLHIQYLSWLGSMLLLDFGISFTSGEPVLEEIGGRIGITLILNLTSMFFIFIISILLGIAAARHMEEAKDRNIKRFALLSFAMPTFYLALLLIQLFSMKLGLTPISGVHGSGVAEGSLGYYIDMGHHLLLPITVMIFGGLGPMIIYVRSLSIEILKSDYYFFAKSRGLGDNLLLRRFIIPNLYPPVITMLGLSLPAILGGSVILETIFGIDGMGLLFYNSALSRDYPVIMGILIVGALLTLLGNILADLVLLKLNPYAKKRPS